LHLAHELSSHLVSQAYLFYSFTLSKIYISGRLYLELWEKSYQDIIMLILSKQEKLLMDLPRLIKKVIGK
jgi:hypothetical protein